MRKLAAATLLRSTAPARECTVELVELDVFERPGTDVLACCIVTLRQGKLVGGVVADARESTLTVVPCRREEAQRRAEDFIRRRVAAGDTVSRSEGFIGIEPDVLTPQAEPRPDDALSSGRDHALAARFAAARWKLDTPARQARTVWRLAECCTTPPQSVFAALVPRLVGLLESGDDLLDLCLAVAIGRLGDDGAAEAMRALSERGRSAATQRAAHQAWVMLLSPTELEAHAAALLPRWTPFDDTTDPLALRGPDGIRRLLDGYDIALVQPAVRLALLQLLARAVVLTEIFQSLRYLYKAAEVRRDAEVLAILHGHIERTLPNVRVSRSGYRQAQGAAMTAFGPRTRDYFRLRGWRHLRRLAAIGHPWAPRLATQLLLSLDDAALPAASQYAHGGYDRGHWRTITRYLHPTAGWLLVPKLLLGQHDGVRTSARATRWWTLSPLDDSRAPDKRVDGLQAMWDRHPDALLQLATHSRCALVHAVVARALQDHAGFVREQPAAVLSALLASAYEPTSQTGLLAVKWHLDNATAAAAQVPWLLMLLASPLQAARDHALLHVASAPAAFASHVDLIAAMLLAEHAPVRRQARGLASLADLRAVLAELASALLATDAAAPGLADACADLTDWLTQSAAGAAAAAPVEPVLCLLDHEAPQVVHVAVDWLLLQPQGLVLLPPVTLTRLLRAQDASRRTAGVRLLSALPLEVLVTQVALLSDLAVQPDASVRAAVSPALERVAHADASFAQALAERLHATLFRTEVGTGAHDDALQWLTQSLAAVAPGRDAPSVWRALHAQSAGAQRYGSWALQPMAHTDFSVRQQATLGRHAHVAVRAWARAALDATLQAGWPPVPAVATDLLPLADTLFDDTRAYAAALFGTRLPDESLDTELLIAWVDHVQPWMQALGRQRLVRRMDAREASLALTRLSQHPSPQVQLFVTQWLLELTADDPLQMAAQLRALKPYFLAVLSQVHRGRVAKSRVTAFLREHTQAPETAAVVAEIFARQVVTASLTDKPQFVAGLRDIAARHPHIEMPFLVWNRPAARQPAA